MWIDIREIALEITASAQSHKEAQSEQVLVSG